MEGSVEVMDLRLNEHGYQPQGRDDSGGRPN
jgi:hypothetical protein